MTNYLVRWEISIEAETPKEAAKQAYEIQQDPQSTATIFEVFKDYYESASPESTIVDLMKDY